MARPLAALRRRLRRHPRRWTAAAVALVALLAAGIAAWVTCGFAGCPDVATLAVYQPEGASLLLDRHGEPFAELAPVAGGRVALHELPSRVPQAFVAVEDRRFFAHGGIDWRRLAGAFVANLRAGGIEEGGSTITMQLARNLFPERIEAERETAGRKLLELRMARAIESHFSKQEILELYLNHIYFGHGAHGIEAASRHYFGHPAASLDLAEAALLAALPKAPSHYDPRAHPQAARERRDLVLALMEEQGRVPPGQAAEARRAPLALAGERPAEPRQGAAPHFAEAVRRELEERFGRALYRRPVRVWTTLDLPLQRRAEEALAAQLAAVEAGEHGAYPGAGEGRPLDGAVVFLDARRGDALAWVGGRDYGRSQFDRVAHTARQPGSAFKPFVYAAALADGHALSEPLEDRPLTVELPGGDTWEPRNADDRYAGALALERALALSKNVATARLAREVGEERVAALAERLGVRPPIPHHPSMALGTVSLSPLELAAAYTPFATLGTRVTPRLVLRVDEPDGTVVWRSEPRGAEVLDPGVAYLVNRALAGAVDRGTGREARQPGVTGPLAGKTGTSDGNADAWFVGYTPSVVGVVWLGFDTPRQIAPGASGGRLAAPVWGRVAAGLGAAGDWQRPESVVERPIDPASGLPLAAGCRPAGAAAEPGLFLADRVPEAHCPGREPPSRQAFAAVRGGDAAPAAPVEERPLAVAEREATDDPAPARGDTAADDVAEAPPEPAAPVAPRTEAPAPVETASAEEREPEREPAEEPAEVPAPLTGWWQLTTRITDSRMERYEGLELGFRVHLSQDGGRITGEGTKWSEAGARLSGGRRTPIRLEGELDGDTLVLSFDEQGSRRASGGVLRFRREAGGRAFGGGFSSDAAGSRGVATLRRLP